LSLATAFTFRVVVHVEPPEPFDISAIDLKREELDDNLFACGSGWMKKNEHGLWEMYLEGNAFERGVIRGKLSKELLARQEKYFVEEIYRFIPSKFYLKFLKYFIAWFNRDLDEYIDPEYLLEIYGISLYTPDKYDFLAPKYQRLLNYHAAHDIGHALVNMNMVGCTSFSAWGNKTADNTLMVGRNFDFNFGDDFSREKIICFINPDKGLKFMMVSWAGMVGAVSGMNESGLTVTINAAKSGIPTKSATPITIVARKILQYASNIEKAYAIASKYETFVSESIMIGSAEDDQTAIIEKTPNEAAIFYSQGDNIICSNHFQSELFKDDPLNQENISTSDSPYRYARMKQLLVQEDQISVESAVTILRERKGLDNSSIGLGNQKAINQLIAHHSIIFKPVLNKFWISTYPYQLGTYVAFDLSKIFDQYAQLKSNIQITESELEIPADPFLFSKDYKEYLHFKEMRRKLKEENVQVDETWINTFISTNPEYYLTYSLLGDFFEDKENCSRANEFYQIALTKEVATKTEEEQIQEKLNGCLN